MPLGFSALACAGPLSFALLALLGASAANAVPRSAHEWAHTTEPILTREYRQGSWPKFLQVKVDAPLIREVDHWYTVPMVDFMVQEWVVASEVTRARKGCSIRGALKKDGVGFPTPQNYRLQEAL